METVRQSLVCVITAVTDMVVYISISRPGQEIRPKITCTVGLYYHIIVELVNGSLKMY